MVNLIILCCPKQKIFIHLLYFHDFLLQKVSYEIMRRDIIKDSAKKNQENQ